MIFGRMSNEGREFVLIGLSNENIAKMKEGEPLSIGPVPGDPALAGMMIIITTGEAEEDMVVMLKKAGLVNPETSINEML